MDILINGMEMPECRSKYYGTPYIYHVAGDIICYPNGEARLRVLLDKTEINCPLIPVPPHGRLIDAERIYDAVEQRYRMSSGIEHRCERDLLDLICAAPTIIPAEEDET